MFDPRVLVDRTAGNAERILVMGDGAVQVSLKSCQRSEKLVDPTSEGPLFRKEALKDRGLVAILRRRVH